MNKADNADCVIEKMTDIELADFVLTATCNELLDKEADVIEVVSRSMIIINRLKVCSNVTATRLFNVLEIIVGNLKEVAGDGGFLKIEAEWEGQ